ncbi:diaminopimelate epimerase [Anaerosporobacter faecicola]|uniref:diaminopimelate epimerase n=1 Tax=Anaerosporobacter faecicola TaxID=2718714 RepID=UPI00143A3E60|nr:diaminopimelate epimerase [Anaerosporobacter faecicola]
MKFSKMHGLGNDYIYINAMEEKVEEPKYLAMQLCRRHTGIGADGIILIKSSSVADYRMDMYNADGSRAQMCGNGIRCVGKYVYEQGLTEKTELYIETLAGVKHIFLEVEDHIVKMVTVDMGEPGLLPEDIPVISDNQITKNLPVKVNDQTYQLTCVSMGNPHAVVFVEDICEVEVEKIGPLLEQHKIFPQRCNIEFVEVITDHILRMRVWERGTGLTLACGTGACACAVASALHAYTTRRVDVILDGGLLTINWDEATNHVYMRGPAEMVFHGEWDIE